EAQELHAFDAPAVRAHFVREDSPASAEADLLLDGLRCAACAWLVEKSLARVAGVTAARVNYATRRASVRFDPRLVLPSALLAAVRAVGYAAWPYEESRLALIEARERRTLLRRLWVAGLAMMQAMMYAVPAYLARDGEITADIAELMRWAGLLLTLPVIAYSAAPFLVGAWRDLRSKRPGMDVPIALGIGVAFVASAWSTVAGKGDVYFDSITMFVFLLLGARYLELLARTRAGQSLQHLARLVPRSAHRLKAAEGLEHDAVPAALLAPGDRVLVKPGEAVPADGELETAEGTFGEAWLTGESCPVVRRRGELVMGGCINAGSACVVRVKRVGADTALSSIKRSMERALSERPAWVAAAEAAATFFVTTILAAAAASTLAWLAIDAGRALAIGVAVLIVTCPCALALATPVALTVGAGAMARRNLVMTRGGAIEALATATDFVFDKTGTLTRGEPQLLETIVLARGRRGDCRALAAAIAHGSSHPLDRALAQAPPDTKLAPVHGHRSEPGRGVEARLGASTLRLGRADFVAGLHGRPAPIAWLATRDTIVWLGDERGWIAAFRLGDSVRAGAVEALAELRAHGARIHLLSGDEAGAAARVAAELGIEEVRARATPEGKREYVRTLQARGARVAMVGDGINDAPVLGQADISIAMGGGADLAQLRADAVLLSDSLEDFVRATAIARLARRIVRQNLAWALAYNLVAVPLAVAGL
ncbi:MAG TPA: cation-translocating P-type ATPase, partial [Usitatibacter sp.]|nr:cation-translocating P-type ATPase [Usitatibacter sp.]